MVSFNIREPTNNNAGHSHIIMTESGMRFKEMEGFLKTPMTLLVLYIPGSRDFLNRVDICAQKNTVDRSEVVVMMFYVCREDV